MTTVEPGFRLASHPIGRTALGEISHWVEVPHYGDSENLGELLKIGQAVEVLSKRKEFGVRVTLAQAGSFSSSLFLV